MSATGHSQFPASSAARLLACPGAFALGKKYDTGGRRSTVFSAEGTLAHSLSEVALFTGADLSDMGGRTFTADGFEFSPDEDFIEAVQTYVDFIQGLEALGYLIALETRVSPMIHWRPMKEPDLGVDLYGTADCIAYHPGSNHLLIVDLKFGKGIAVEVQDNAQLLYYGAGALSLPLINYIRQTHGLGPTNQLPDKLDTIVVQPRAHHPDGPTRKAEYSTKEVVNWSRDVLYAGVDRAIQDDGKTLNAGSHCRFCPALAHCPAYEQMLKDETKAKFLGASISNAPVQSTTGTDLMPVANASPAPAPVSALPATHMSDEKLGELLDRIALLKPYFAALEQLAEERLKASRDVKNWKLVPTRTRRVWNDDEPNIVSALHNMGVAPGQYTETRLLSPAQVERQLGKRQFKALLQQTQLVKQSTPGLSLVPASDPRTHVKAERSAKEAFGLPSP